MLPASSWLEIRGARHNNLKNIDVKIPLGAFTVVTGPSGSGKSSLVEDVLYASLARTLHRAKTFPGAHDSIRGIEQINKVIRVDQQPLGQTPSSNPATFTGAFDLIRALFAQLPEAKLRGYQPRRFSFNVPGGRCEKCEGNGQLRIEMHFLPDVWVECDTCHGRRYNEETLSVRYHGKSIAEVLEMPCGEAVQLFKNIPKIRRILQTLCDVGLDYLTLGQPAPTLSGGEAQRVKLAAELSRPDTGNTLYLLDEPTTGLHFDDLAKLLDVLNRLVELGNTVVVIEHNLDVIKTADWVIDMGPEAGDEGGYVVVAGTPEDVAAHGEAGSRERAGHLRSGSGRRSDEAGRPRFAGPSPRSPLPAPRSYTGEALGPVLAAGPHEPRKLFDFAAVEAQHVGDRDIADVGQDARMPWEIDGRHWHTVARVGRNGKPCRWEGRILAEVVDRIQNQSELFSDTDWNSRSVVEIRAAKKADGWFFHAITGEEWLLKMKFRTARNTFSRDELVRRLDLKPLNDMPELPLYGTEPRVKVRSLRGPWQEIEIRVTRTARSTARSSGPSSTRRWAVSASTRSRPRRRPTSCSPGSNSAANGISPAAAFRWAARSSGRWKCWRSWSSCSTKRRPMVNCSGTTSRSCRSTCPSSARPGPPCRRKSSTPSTCILPDPRAASPKGGLPAWGSMPKSTARRPAWTCCGSSSARPRTCAAETWRGFLRNIWQRWKRRTNSLLSRRCGFSGGSGSREIFRLDLDPGDATSGFLHVGDGRAYSLFERLGLTVETNGSHALARPRRSVVAARLE